MNQSTDLKSYWKDARNNLVHVSNIKEIDMLRTEIVTKVSEEAIILSQHLASVKKQFFNDILSFIDLSIEQYQAKIGGKKGNTTLYSFDGKFKIQYAISEYLQFDERIHAAKSLIDECLKDWTQDSLPEIKTLITRAFDVDKEGNLSTGRILALRRVDIKDPRWLNAMSAISDSIQVVGSKAYIRVYVRDELGTYNQVMLDFASV